MCDTTIPVLTRRLSPRVRRLAAHCTPAHPDLRPPFYSHIPPNGVCTRETRKRGAGGGRDVATVSLPPCYTWAGEGSSLGVGSDLSRKLRNGLGRGKTKVGDSGGPPGQHCWPTGGNVGFVGDSHAKPHSQGTMASTGKQVWLSRGGGVVLEAKDAAKCPMTHRAAPHDEESQS